jgi:hypothetical protein
MRLLLSLRCWRRLVSLRLLHSASLLSLSGRGHLVIKGIKDQVASICECDLSTLHLSLFTLLARQLAPQPRMPLDALKI